jgi:hypothetical protein
MDVIMIKRGTAKQQTEFSLTAKAIMEALKVWLTDSMNIP